MQKINKGFLKEIYDKCFEHFLNGIDPEIHKNAYIGEHPAGFAESEFAGKYMDICTRFYKYNGDERVLLYAKTVADSVIDNQRNDGYIGGYEKGKEWTEFSVWNQAFTAIGLISVWEITENGMYLNAAEKSIEFIAHHFIESKADILDAPNYGSQHLAIMIPTVKLYEITGKEIYIDFIEYIFGCMKGSDNDFTEFESILSLRSKKAIENFCCLIGIEMYAEQTENKKLTKAVKKYRDELAMTQITETGNGTVAELWYKDGNTPRFLDISLRPNENCVAVGWAELNAILFRYEGSAEYLDEIERTLFNHIIGSLDKSCTDFAYYQPNFGKRITRTKESAYKCCRYRGFSAISCLPENLFLDDGGCIIPMVYTNAYFENENVRITEETDYPFDSKIKFNVKGISTIKLRIPKWCEKYTLTVNGSETFVNCENGYITLEGRRDNDDIVLDLNTEPRHKSVLIDGEKYLGIRYGGIVCALSADNEEAMFKTKIDISRGLERVYNTEYSLEYKAVGYVDGSEKEIRIADYASAGKISENSAFTVWIKE